MFLSLSRKVVTFRLPIASMVAVNRNYTHLKNKLDPNSHLYKERVESQGDRTAKKVDKIVVDPTNDYKFKECRVFVDNIPLQATWKDLKDHFRGAGVNYVSISKDPITGKSKGCGIVQFDTVDQTSKAVTELQGSLLHGSPLKIWLDRKREVGGALKKTVHSLPNSSKLRGDIKSSSEFEAFQRERNRNELERNDRGDKDGRPAGLDRAKRTDSRHNKDGERDRRPEMKNNNELNSDRNGREREDSRIEERNIGAGRSSKHASSERKEPGSPARGDVAFKFTPSFFNRDVNDHTELSPELLNEIEFLVDCRADCRDFGNYENADSIRLRLRNDFNVQCDDVAKTWRVLSSTLPDGTPRPKRAR